MDAEGERVKNEDLPKKLRDHAWFVGYAPADIPQVAAAVIVENSGSGGRIAGPIARKLLDGYLLEEGRLPPPPEESDSDSESGENVAADAESELQESQTESSAESENDSESDSDSADSENNSESENISEDDSENGGDEESADGSPIEQNEDNGDAIDSAVLEFANLSLLKSKTQLEGGDG